MLTARKHLVQLIEQARQVSQTGYVPAGLMIQIAMAQAAIPAPPIDEREGVADRLPQGTRLDSPSFREASRHRAPNGRRLRGLRVQAGLHRPAPSGPPAAELPRGRPAKAPAYAPSRRMRVWHWNKQARPIKVSSEDWELLRLATVEEMTAPQIAAKLGGGITPSAVRKRLSRTRAAVKAAN